MKTGFVAKVVDPVEDLLDWLEPCVMSELGHRIERQETLMLGKEDEGVALISILKELAPYVYMLVYKKNKKDTWQME